MSKKTNKKDEKQSFWTTLPGILTALTALITAIGGLVAALSAAGLLGAGSVRASSSLIPAPKSDPTALAQTFLSTYPSSAATVPTGCFKDYFQGMAKERVASLESGTDNFQLIGPDQTKDEPAGIIFTDNSQLIGGIEFRLYSNDRFFKIDSVVDSNCNKIEEYSNQTRGGDRTLLQNWDSLQMQFGNAGYELELGYNGSIIASFRKSSP